MSLIELVSGWSFVILAGIGILTPLLLLLTELFTRWIFRITEKQVVWHPICWPYIFGGMGFVASNIKETSLRSYGVNYYLKGDTLFDGEGLVQTACLILGALGGIYGLVFLESELQFHAFNVEIISDLYKLGVWLAPLNFLIIVGLITDKLAKKIYKTTKNLQNVLKNINNSNDDNEKESTNKS